MEEHQNLFQGTPDFVINLIRGKGDQPRGEVGQEFLKPQAAFGYGAFSRAYLIAAIHRNYSACVYRCDTVRTRVDWHLYVKCDREPAALDRSPSS